MKYKDKEMQDLLDMFSGFSTSKGKPIKPKGNTMTRKKRVTKVKAIEFDDVDIRTVANGFIVTSTTSGDNEYVFNDIEIAFEFIRSKLKPTSEQQAVLRAI